MESILLQHNIEEGWFRLELRHVSERLPCVRFVVKVFACQASWSTHATASWDRPETWSLVAAEKPFIAQRNLPPFTFLLWPVLD